MSILFVQAPLVVNQCLAQRIGLNEAIVLQQVHYWIQRGTSGIQHEGHRWIYNTLEEWGEQFPFWSRDQIKRIFASLKKQGVLSIEQLRKKDHDRTNFYAVDYGHELLKAAEINERAKSPIRAGEIAPSMGANPPRRTAENRPVDGCKSAPSKGAESPHLTETTTENTSEITTETTQITEAAVATTVQGVEPVRHDDPLSKIPADMPGPKDPNAKTFKVWANYAITYRRRYSVWPVWNARVAAQLGKLIDRVGTDAAPKVAAYYLGISDQRYITEQHSVGLLLARAEALHTQWATGTRVNSTTARQNERTAANFEAAQTAIGRLTGEAPATGGSIYDNPFYIR